MSDIFLKNKKNNKNISDFLETETVSSLNLPEWISLVDIPNKNEKSIDSEFDTSTADLEMKLKNIFKNSQNGGGEMVDLVLNGKNKSFIFDFFEGIKLILSNSIIKFSIVLSGLTSFVGRGVLETLPLISEGIFHQGPSGLGLITATAGAGALFASITKALGKAETMGTNIPDSILFTAITIPLTVLLIGYVDTFYMALFLIFILGFLATTIGISIQSKIQLELKDIFRGRVMSIWIMINMGSAALGSILFGMISDYSNIQFTHILFGYTFIILIVFLISVNKIGKVIKIGS